MQKLSSGWGGNLSPNSLYSLIKKVAEQNSDAI